MIRARAFAAPLEKQLSALDAFPESDGFGRRLIKAEELVPRVDLLVLLV